MQAIYDKVVKWYHDHGTKILAALQGAVLTVSGFTNLLSVPQLKVVMAISAALVFLRGFSNTANTPPAA